MTRKARFWLVFGIVGSTVISIVGIVVVLYNPFLASRMVSFYSDDSNYYKYEATITDFSKTEKEAYVELGDVLYIDEGAPRAELNSRWAAVFSRRLDEAWAEFNPEIGLHFEFVGNLRVFYDGGTGVIVSLTARESLIISFDDGKAALLEWARGAH